MNTHYNVKSRVLKAFAHLMAPLVRILIRNGISFYEFAEVLKATFVKVCEEEFAVPDGGETTSARISIRTGLTRRDVDRVLEGDSPAASALRMDDSVARVLQGWHEDKDFVGPYGIPRSLFYDSDPTESQTFVDLVKRYRAEVPPHEVLEVLLRSGSVVRLEGSGNQASVLVGRTRSEHVRLVRQRDTEIYRNQRSEHEHREEGPDFSALGVTR